MSMPKQTITEKSTYWLKVISLGLILGLGIQFAEAWTSPTLSPPDGNILGGPLTTGSVGQWKQGNLALNTDGLYANALLIPSGNVGIGIVNPTEKLEVNGNVKTTGVLTAGKVQIVDVVVENTDCAPMGLVARDNTGILLSCQGSPLKWKKASGGGGSDCADGILNNQIQIITNAYCASAGVGSSILNQCRNGVLLFIGCVVGPTGGD